MKESTPNNNSLYKLAEQIANALNENGVAIDDLNAADKDKIFKLFEKLDDELRKDPRNIEEAGLLEPKQAAHMVRVGLFLI